MAEGTDISRRLSDLYRLQRLLIERMSKDTMQSRAQRIKERKNTLQMINDSRSDYVDITKNLEKAAQGDRDSLRKALTAIERETIRSNTRLTEAMTTDLPELADFEAQYNANPWGAWQALTGMFGEGSDLDWAAYPAAVNQALRQAFPKAQPRLDDDPEVLRSLLSVRLNNDEVDAVMGIIARANDIQRDASTTIKINNNRVQGVGTVLRRLPGADDADIRSMSQQYRKMIDEVQAEFQKYLVADPQVIEDRIKLEELDYGVPQMTAQLAKVERQIDDLLGEKEEVSSQALSWLEDPFTQEWARTNNIDLGYVNRDEQGKVIGFQRGKDFHRGVSLWRFQSRNPNKWGRMFQPAGGQFTSQIVEMKPQVAEMAMTGEPGDPNQDVYIRFGDVYYQRGKDGTFEIVPQKDVPATADDGSPLGFVTAVRVKEDGAYAPVIATDLKDRAVVGDIAPAESPEESEELKQVYNEPVVGVLEALHVNRAGEHGKGYRAVITEDGERIVMPHADVRVIEDTGPKADPAEVRGVRRLLKGKFPGLPGAATDPMRDDTAERQLYGTQIYEGDAKRATPDKVQRLRDFLAQQRTGELPIDSAVREDEGGILGFLRKKAGRGRGVGRDDVRRELASRRGITLPDLEDFPEQAARTEGKPPRRPGVETVEEATRVAETLTEPGRRREVAEGPGPDYEGAVRAGQADYAEKAAGLEPKSEAVEQMDVETGGIDLGEEVVRGTVPTPDAPEPKGTLSFDEQKRRAAERIKRRRAAGSQ